MYEVRVTGHPTSEKAEKIILMIKMFRMVTALGLKESKDAVEQIIGRKWEYSTSPTGRAMEPGRHVYKERKPFVMKADTYIKARQFEIEFKHGGFTVEVVKVDGQG